MDYFREKSPPRSQSTPPDDVGNHEAVSNRPHSEAGAGHSFGAGVESTHWHHADARNSLTAHRVLTVKLDFERAQWDRLCELAWQAMQYKNWFSVGHFLHVLKFRPPEDADKNAETYMRARHKGELSGAAYSAAERDVTAKWTRDGKRILAGAPLPQFRHADSFSIRGNKNRAESGVRIVEGGAGKFLAHLSVQADTCEGGCWMTIPLARGTARDDRHAPLLAAMARGNVPILRGNLVFKFGRYRLLLQLAYEVPLVLPPMGQRVATLGIVSADDPRLLLRTETRTIDYTHKLVAIRERKTHWDGLRRRLLRDVGRRRDHARTKRVLFAHHTFEDWCRTYVHQWSHDVIEWCGTQGVGRLIVADLAGGDWPAHQMQTFLAYKGKERAIAVEGIEGASLDDPSTLRAVEAKVKKRQRKARKLGDALRELNHQLPPPPAA